MVSHTSENIINYLTNIVRNIGFYWGKKVKINKGKPHLIVCIKINKPD